ncbi:LuxR C-terminal-related transcriptional regulator [Erythrobacter sp. NAP1]|uniref:LuxR C-terminal-related transcriptional regulator n=1 Tax=Erythrobacter sp. NAP1 TaxID=237727 RepID=UPI0003242DA2|nr:LuxR C-terminal-related transcriptional regulator [Erythrobacter sp. NAP1]
MPSPAARSLTERQRAVMEMIDRRASIKVIAQELGVSETRINQHIRALKDIYEAESLGELVECYRADNAEISDTEGSGAYEDAKQTEGVTSKENPYSEPAYKNNQVPNPDLITNTHSGNDPGELVMSDVLPLEEQAPWLRPGEPRVVARALDGEHAVLYRLAAIVGIAFGFLAAVVLTVTAAVTLSDALEGRATVPVDERGFS